MPATRFSSRVKSTSKGKEPADRNPPSVQEDDDVIIISSDDEAPDSTTVALRKAQQEIRSLKRRLLGKEASGSQVLSEHSNNHTDDLSSSERFKKSEESLRIEARMQQAAADIHKLQSALRSEKELRLSECKRLKKRAKAAEMETEHLKIVNQELRRNADERGNDNKVLHDLENHISCEVCTEKLWHPYTLSGCGHAFCQGCLTDWFNMAFISGADHYTCPTCRAPVLHKPVEDYALKGIVRVISHAVDPAGASPPAPVRPPHGHGPWFRFFR